MDAIIQQISIREKLIIEKYINDQMGRITMNYVRAHGGFGNSIRNEEGEKIFGLATSYDLVMTNTCIKKRVSIFYYI